MRDADILIGLHVLSCQNDFSLIMFILFLPVNMTLIHNSEYLKWSFSIGYFERYVNLKSDYLELLLSVFSMRKVKASHNSVQVQHVYESYFSLEKNPALSDVQR